MKIKKERRDYAFRVPRHANLTTVTVAMTGPPRESTDWRHLEMHALFQDVQAWLHQHGVHFDQKREGASYRYSFRLNLNRASAFELRFR